MAMVGDGLTRERRSARKGMCVTGIEERSEPNCGRLSCEAQIRIRFSTKVTFNLRQERIISAYMI
jgi:hypothetical protein